MITAVYRNDEKELLKLIDFNLFRLQLGKLITIEAVFLFAAILVVALGGGWVSLIALAFAVIYPFYRRYMVRKRTLKTVRNNSAWYRLRSTYTFDEADEKKFRALLASVIDKKDKTTGETVEAEKSRKETFVPYDSVARAVRHKGRFYIFLSVSIVIIPETAITEGTADGLEALLKKVLGKRFGMGRIPKSEREKFAAANNIPQKKKK